jgi:hypothetical protein
MVISPQTDHLAKQAYTIGVPATFQAKDSRVRERRTLRQEKSITMDCGCQAALSFWLSASLVLDSADAVNAGRTKLKADAES